MLDLRLIGETSNTITLGWTPVGNRGYRFTREKANGKWSHTWDSTRSSATFSKDSAWYRVEALGLAESAQYPPVSPPPPPPPEQTAISDLKGVCIYRTTDLANAAQYGIKHLRCDYWLGNDVNFNAEAKRLGMKVLTIIGYGAWRASPSGSGGTDKYPPSDFLAWTNSHLNVLNYDTCEAVEIWNEPWLATGALDTGAFWLPKSDPKEYLRLIKTYATEAWKKKPDLTILFSLDFYMQGSLNPVWDQTPDSNWQNALLAADTEHFLADPRFRPSVHCYCGISTPDDPRGKDKYTGLYGWAFDRYKIAYDALKSHGHPDPQAWVTEFGWCSQTSGGTGSEPKVTEQQQSDYTARGIQKMRDSGIVERAHIFEFKSGDAWNYNMLRPDNSPKPVCAAVRDVT